VAAPSPDLAEVLTLCDSARQETGGAFDANLPGGFDPSGLVKGWAVERAALRHLPDATSDSDWLVNAGGDIVLHAAGGRTWRVGIEDPADPTRTVRTFALASGAVATSGSAHRGAHLIDPRSGRPVTGGLRAATVLAPTLLQADVWATAAYVVGEPALATLARMPGIRALLVRADGSLVSTGGAG
jgi:thiamine biosynthesis lipoprotein